MTPIFKFTLDGRDITSQIRPAFSSLNFTDGRGTKADNLTLTLADPHGNLTFPDPGRALKFWLGTREQGLVFKGIFTIDEITHSGPPDTLNVRAHSADFTAGLKVKKETFYENQTVGQIVEFIAGLHGLGFAVSQDLRGSIFDHISQTNESDLNLLHRMAKDIGAYFAVKNNTLFFSEEAISTSASGKSLPAYTISRRQSSSFNFNEQSRKNKFTGSKAAWHNIDNAKKIWESAGDPKRVKALDGVYPDALKAQRAADAALARLSRGELTMSINLAVGDPALIPETPVSLSGWPSRITRVRWVIVSVTHTLGNQGLLSALNLEQAS
jgi:phage protein D